MTGIEALHKETKLHRLGRAALWLVGFILLKLLVNNAVGFFIDREAVMASTQTNIPKVGSTVSALCGDTPFLGFLINVGNFAMNSLYPALMALAFVWFGWNIAAWLPYLGYAIGAFVYYTVGVQSISGNDVGLNGLPLYVLIPAIGMAVSVIIQFLFNKLVHKEWLHSYVEPCFDPNTPIIDDEDEE